MKRILLVTLIIGAFLSSPTGISAQSSDLPDGTITGQITNLTAGSTVPAGQPLMLHVWDRDFNEKIMRDGKTDTSGHFRFADVPMNHDWYYAVMITYEDVLYFSAPVSPEPNNTDLTLAAAVYERTGDTAAVQVDRRHIIFDVTPDGLLVGEVYILSNLGDRTIAGGVAADTPISPLQYSLPEGATDITFDGNENSRFLLTPGGFVDNAPLRPGEGTGQVTVRYVLPYEDGMSFKINPDWPTMGISLFVPAGIGLEIGGADLRQEETRDMGNGRQMTILSHPALDAGEAFTLSLSGDLAITAGLSPIDSPGGDGMSGQRQTQIALGAMLGGILLISVAIWWQRGQTATVDNAGTNSAPNRKQLDDLILQIADLDIAFEQGAIESGRYDQQRAMLRQQAQALIIPD